MIPHTFFAEPRFVGAAVFFVDEAALGLPASAFLGARAFLVMAAFPAPFVALALPVVVAFLLVPLLLADLEGGFEFWDNPS